jgi:NADP-dependent 3-hydroxy acid dehydrogenase YdfG
MANNLTNYLETRLLEHSVNKTAFTAPAAVGLALYTTAPNVDTGAGGTEVSAAGTAYTRINILTANAGGHVFGAATAADPSTIANAVDITFPTATGAWGTVAAVAILDSTTVGAGNILWTGNLAASKTIASGDVFKILSGQLILTLD